MFGFVGMGVIRFVVRIWGVDVEKGSIRFDVYVVVK